MTFLASHLCLFESFSLSIPRYVFAKVGRLFLSHDTTSSVFEVSVFDIIHSICNLFRLIVSSNFLCYFVRLQGDPFAFIILTNILVQQSITDLGNFRHFRVTII